MEGIAGAAGLLAEGFLKTTLVLVPALLGAAACRRRPASFRHFLLSFALIGLLFLPLFRLLPGGWRTPFLPAPPSAAASSSAVLSALVPPAPISNAGREAAFFLPGRSGPTDVQGGESAAGGRAVPSAGAAERFFPVQAAVVLWLAGFVFLSLRLAFGLAGARRLTREGWDLDDAGWRILIARFLAMIPLRRRVRLKSHPEVAVPLTWGWRKPVVLIPAGADAWEETERSAALFHELSHVKRADFLFLLLVRLSLAVFWWNPLCWLAYARLRKEQEIACDELALRAGIKPSIYAAGLLAFRSSADFRGRASSVAPGLLGGPFFKDRLAAILAQRQTFKEVKMKSRIMLAALVVLAVAFIGTARPAAAGNAASSPGAPVEETLSIASAAAPAAAQEVNAEKETTKEKEKEKTALKEKEKEKEKEKASVKTIMVTAGGDKGRPLEITITGDGQMKKLLLDKPLTLKTGEDGRITFSVEGREITVPKNGTISIQGVGDPLRLIKEGRLLRLKGGKAVARDEDGDKIVVIEKPGEGGSKHAIVKEIRIKKGEAGREIEIDKEIEAGELPVKVIIEKQGKRRPGVVWTTAGEGPAVIGERDLLEKVKAIREKAEAVKAKTLEFEELEKSLEKLEAELKDAEDRLKNITVRIDQGKDVRIVREDEAGEKSFAGVEAGDAGKDGEPLKVVCRRDAGTLEITLTGMNGPEGRSAYDRALARMKRDLPKEAKLLDSNFDEGGGKMTFKLEVSAETSTDKDYVDAVIDIVSEETKK